MSQTLEVVRNLSMSDGMPQAGQRTSLDISIMDIHDEIVHGGELRTVEQTVRHSGCGTIGDSAGVHWPP